MERGHASQHRPHGKANSQGRDIETATSYRNDDLVDVYVAYYWSQDNERELLSGQNAVDPAPTWTAVAKSSERETLGNTTIPIIETILNGTQGERVVWHTYWIGGQFVTGTLAGKLAQAQSILTFGETRSAAFALSTHAQDDRGYARDRLRTFFESDFPVKEVLANVQPVKTRGAD